MTVAFESGARSFHLIFISHSNVFNYLLAITYLCAATRATHWFRWYKAALTVHKFTNEHHKTKEIPYVPQLIHTNSWHVTRIDTHLYRIAYEIYRMMFFFCHRKGWIQWRIQGYFFRCNDVLLLLFVHSTTPGNFVLLPIRDTQFIRRYYISCSTSLFTCIWIEWCEWLWIWTLTAY